MIPQITSLLYLIVWFMYVSYIFLVPSFLLGKDKFLSPTIKSVFQSLVCSQLNMGFKPNIFYCNELEPSGNVDIVIVNHISSIDWGLILILFNHFGINNYITVGKKDLSYFPGVGFNFMIDNHIKLVRNWEEDKKTLVSQIEKINNGVIFIFPEGTRFEPKKRDEGQLFSRENNLPEYDYLLVPKSKGLWTIYNLLKEKNKMGKIYDMTIVMQNFVGNNAYLNDLVTKETGNIFFINRELKQPESYIENADFKKWLLEEWKKKDNLIKMYQKLVYQKLEYKENREHNHIGILLVIVFTWLLIQKKELRYYMLLSIVMSYIIIKFKKI